MGPPATTGVGSCALAISRVFWPTTAAWWVVHASAPSASVAHASLDRVPRKEGETVPVTTTVVEAPGARSGRAQEITRVLDRKSGGEGEGADAGTWSVTTTNMEAAGLAAEVVNVMV